MGYWHTNADPGSGKVRGNSGTVGSITTLYISETDNDGTASPSDLAIDIAWSLDAAGKALLIAPGSASAADSGSCAPARLSGHC